MKSLSELQKYKEISLIDLTCQYKNIQTEIEDVALKVLSSGRYILDENVDAFEEELAAYLGCKYVISCANGTDAIVLALRALDIKEDDEVITVSNSFFATSEAVALCSAKPVFVDIQETDFNINPNQIEKAITKKTRAILPVHLYGQPCDIDKVLEIAKKNGLYVIEDCAQALGAKLNNKPVGTFGNAGTVSFFPTKNLGAFGDGGAVLTNDESIAKKIKQLRVHGSQNRYEHNYIGLNSRLDEIQAAILRIKLKYLDKWNKDRQHAAKYYNQLLKDVNGVIVPAVKPGCYHIFHQYSVRLKNRDYIYTKLQEMGIQTSIYYPIPIHLQKAFSYLDHKNGLLPVTEKVCSEVLSLPIYPEITKNIQECVIGKIKKLL